MTADESQTIRAIDWRELFPFTHVFRAFHIAIHPSKIILGLLLILGLFIGGCILDAFWPSASLPYANDLQRYEEVRMARMAGADSGALLSALPSDDEARIAISHAFFHYERTNASAVINSAFHGDPSAVGDSLAKFLLVGPGWLVQAHLVYAILLSGVFLILWSVFGGAIARIAAVHVTRDEKISVRQAISFSTSKIVSFVFAPLIPVMFILLDGFTIAFGALLFYASHPGLIVAAFLFFLLLVAGSVMTLAATGMIGGFNLMYPTIATEGSDSFDAISRSFSYVFSRPWKMLFYSAVALAYGAICYEFLHVFIFVLLKMSHFFAWSWLKGSAANTFALVWPSPGMHALVHTPNYPALNRVDALGAAIISFWIHALVSVLGAFLISFYFSANTIIYSLLRLEVDATELGDVYFEEFDEELGDPAINRPGDAAVVVPLAETAPSPSAPPAADPPVAQ
jgi:hypothetical protein